MNDTSTTHRVGSSRRGFLAAAVGGSAVYVGGRATGLDPVTVNGATRWRAGIDPAGQVRAVGSDAAYASDGEGSVIAFALDSGAERWRFDTDDATVRQVETNGDAAYVRTEGGLYAVAIDEGERRWAVEPDGHPRALVVEDEGLFVGTDTDLVYRVSHVDGTVAWRASVVGAPWRTARTDTDAVFVGTSAGTVAALERDDGDRRWRFEVAGDGGRYEGPPRFTSLGVDAASRTLLVWDGENSTLRGLSTRDGTERWRVQLATGGSGFRGDIVPGSVYVPDGRTVLALDPRSGTEHARVEVDSQLAHLRVIESGVVASGVGSVYGVSPSEDRVRWRYDTGRNQALLLSEATDEGIVASEVDGVLHALSTGGSLRWEHDLDAPLHGTPLVADGTVVAGTRAGTVYAITDPSGTPGTAAKRVLDDNRRFSLASGLVGGGLLAAGHRLLRE